jgi:hypothetical protein
LTESGEPDPNGSIEYDVARVYILRDKNINVTSSMVRKLDQTLDWSGSDEKVSASYSKLMSDHLSFSDTVTNIAPIYQSLLGVVNDEISLALSMICTKAQVDNVMSASTKDQCSENEMNNHAVTDCSCCMLHDEFVAAGEPADKLDCNTFLQEDEHIISTLSLFAFYDGGVPIKEASPTTFDETMFKQTSIHTPLVQTHTVNDIIFGYPSAFIGKVVPLLYMSEGKQLMIDNGVSDPTSEQVATEILNGNMDGLITFPLGNLAAYTKDVGAVCLSTCSYTPDTDLSSYSPLESMCSGFAPERHSLSATDEVVLGDIDCKPYSSTFSTVKMCSDIESRLNQIPNDPDYAACVCADGSEDWKTSGCCLASGIFNTIDLTATGCLYPVTGVLDPNYAGKASGSSSDIPTIDLGKAVEDWKDNEESKKSSRFMCPASGIAKPEHAFFGYYEKYEGKANHTTYYFSGDMRMKQGDVNNGTAYVSTVTGYDPQHFKPLGLKAPFNEMQLSIGHFNRVNNSIWISDIKSPLNFTEDWVARPIVCDSSDLCHILARLKPDKYMLAGSASPEKIYPSGIGLPYDGLLGIGFMEGPTANGRPTYFHQPLYLDGDEALYSQGINMYRPKNFDSDPGVFTVGGSNANYELVNKELVDSLKSEIQSYIDLEPATGLGIRSKMRFGVSASVWEGASNLLSPNLDDDKIIPSYWKAEERTLVDDDDVSELSDIAKKYRKTQQRYGMLMILFYGALYILGLPMLCHIGFFQGPLEFLKNANISTREQRGKSLALGQSTASSAEA